MRPTPPSTPWLHCEAGHEADRDRTLRLTPQLDHEADPAVHPRLDVTLTMLPTPRPAALMPAVTWGGCDVIGGRDVSSSLPRVAAGTQLRALSSRTVSVCGELWSALPAGQP